MPARMRNRPVSRSGYPVPYFVQTKDEDDDWDFRIVNPHTYVEALSKKVCWICGQQLGRYRTFVIGPMCAVNRVTAEPPSHRECAEWAVMVCPFMISPRMRRNDANFPEGIKKEVPGVAIERNPGVTMLWHTERGSYHPFKVDNGFLFRLDCDPLNAVWYREGRSATRDEVMESVNSGLPTLWEMANVEGPRAVNELATHVAAAHVKFFDRIAT